VLASSGGVPPSPPAPLLELAPPLDAAPLLDPVPLPEPPTPPLDPLEAATPLDVPRPHGAGELSPHAAAASASVTHKGAAAFHSRVTASARARGVPGLLLPPGTPAISRAGARRARWLHALHERRARGAREAHESEGADFERTVANGGKRYGACADTRPVP
jgi:hypothetical protein